jgi:hypothetical protein
MGTLRTRLGRLEKVATRKKGDRNRPWTPRQWLDAVEALARAGSFAAEPDASLAIDLFRTAVERGDPDPVEWEWVSEILGRVIHGEPPVTEAEYQELAAWYERNSSADQRVDRANLRYALATRGPRRMGATEVVEELRTLRAAHPEWERCLAEGGKPS